MSDKIAMSKPTHARAATLVELESHLGNIYTQKFLLLSAVKHLEMQFAFASSVLTEQEYQQMLDRAQSALSLLKKLG